MKKYLFLGALLLLSVGCSNIPPRVELTPNEISKLNGNTNVGAEILIKKAILNDMAKYTYTEEEKNALKESKENIEIEFYLNRLASKKVNITDEKVLEVYNANKEKLKEIKPEIALPQIKEQLILQQINNEKIKYINSLVEKYQLNSKLNSYFPKANTEN